jgi:hypothetical protein
LLLSPLGYREPVQIHRIVRKKARVQGAMASIVEWQRCDAGVPLLARWSHARFFALFGVIRPIRYDPPAPAGDYDHASMWIILKRLHPGGLPGTAYQQSTDDSA